ncbi:hypothetical protein BC936DRAFT_146504 [Jimgerdemannia flammicorona]|uniref:Uncharacterized protein n=2 Tax=Jimgerdemannia flammicorona TaxID=994334 RepID=A0A433D7G9_9FUNG|nr:hypothetical protein BC936DRAFT_146504 [Jimgerdemannia flammicorona]RUS25627.1 hypothetical protein BC938DRAFT_471869 [Jimgerdemannia flammicorona]
MNISRFASVLGGGILQRRGVLKCGYTELKVWDYYVLLTSGNHCSIYPSSQRLSSDLGVLDTASRHPNSCLEYIPEIITYVQKIADNGYAYVVDGSSRRSRRTSLREP